jgi:hypothetical protein
MDSRPSRLSRGFDEFDFDRYSQAPTTTTTGLIFNRIRRGFELQPYFFPVTHTPCVTNK